MMRKVSFSKTPAYSIGAIAGAALVVAAVNPFGGPVSATIASIEPQSTQQPSIMTLPADCTYNNATFVGIMPHDGRLELRSMEYPELIHQNTPLLKQGRQFRLEGPRQQLGETLGLVLVIYPSAEPDDTALPIPPQPVPLVSSVPESCPFGL